ncbi:MAG: hypothetical protein U0R71_06285 [Solirubrobacterales bacterium]
MNFLKKGPEIKLSEIKVPGFLRDLYYDLKDRHLLPLAAILIVAIVAVPFLLGKSGGATGGGAGSAGGATATAEAGGRADELVAKSAPGLRAYSRRLDHLTSKNPFNQQYRHGQRGSAAGGTSEAGGEGSTTITEVTGEETEVTVEPGGSGESSGGQSGEPGEPGGVTWYSYAIDVRVTTGSVEGNSLAVAGNSLSADGGTAGGAPVLAKAGRKTTVRHNLPELTMLPSREAPALTYMGSSKDGKKALMLVSSDVTGLFGDARCVIGSSTCQLLALEAGLPETVVYGGEGRTFKIEVTGIHLVASKEPKKAPLGKPHRHPEG